MKSEQYAQSLPFLNFQEEDQAEGGLDVRQLASTLRRRWAVIAGVTVALMAGAWVKTLSDPPSYKSEFELLVQPMSAETEVTATVPGSVSNLNRTETVVNQDLIKILTSPRVMSSVVEKLQARYPDLTFKDLLRDLAVGTVGEKSKILQVQYEAKDPAQVRTTLELLSKAYLDYSLQSRQSDIRRGLSFLEKKLPDLRQRVETLQEELQQLRLRHDLIDPQSRGNQLSEQVNTFTTQQIETTNQLKQLRAVLTDLQGQVGAQPNESAASSALSENPRYQTLLTQILQLDGQIAQAATLYLDTSPDMEVLQEQRQNLLLLLAREGQQAEREVISRIRELDARQQAIDTSIGSLNTGVKELSGITREYTDIQRELQIATENLNQFLAKREALQIDVAQREIPWELITPPTQVQLTNNTLVRNLALGMVLGLLVGTGIALLLERLSDAVRSSEEIKRITKMPLLAVIPQREEEREQPKILVGVGSVLQQADSILGGDEPASRNGSHPYKSVPFDEAFRSLFTNLRMLNSDTPIRSVVISSAAQGEGKSTVAAHLARAAAAMGQRVLLIDSDLRNPMLHTYMDMDNHQGLTNVVIGDLELRDAVQRWVGEPRLYVLTAGTLPPDPTRVLSSNRMQQLMEQVQNRFDLVIYDTPPLLGFADAYLVAAQTDGLALVTDPKKLKRSLLEEALEQLRTSKVSLLGIVTQKEAVL